MRKLIVLLSFFLLNSLFSQDTLIVMQYNLLYFGVNFGDCNPNSNNSVTDKITDLQQIAGYIKPDIFTVNELSSNSFYHELILDNVFNTNGVNYYQMGNPPNISESNIINQIFYNSEKLTLISENTLSTGVRDIDFFKFSCNYQGFTDDTIFLTCIVAHLKAGSDLENEQTRAEETFSLMSYLNDNNATGNYLFMGDLNLYNNGEQAFQYLTNHYNESIRFYDPVGKIGSWHENNYYRQYHTQSTHTDSDCFTSGGMDDRFDFILISDEIMEGIEGMQYIDNSYWAVGQDGEHLNSSLLDYPDNTSVPQNVLSALYDMSDHLPVKLGLLVDKSLGLNHAQAKDGGIWVVYESNTGELHFNIPANINPVNAEIIDMTGRIFYHIDKSFFQSRHSIIESSQFANGIYLLLVYDNLGQVFPIKFSVSSN